MKTGIVTSDNWSSRRKLSFGALVAITLLFAILIPKDPSTQLIHLALITSIAVSITILISFAMRQDIKREYVKRATSESEFLSKEIELLKKQKWSITPAGHGAGDIQNIENLIIKESYSDAEKALQELRKIAPKDMTILCLLVRVYLSEGYPDKALTLLKKEERDFQNDALYHRTIAYIYRILRDMDSAVRCGNKAIELEPSNFKGYLSLAYTYWLFYHHTGRTGQPSTLGYLEKAIEISEEGLKKTQIVNEQNKLKNNLAFYYAELGDIQYKEKALAYSKSCYETNKDNPYYIDTYGYVLLKFADNSDIIYEALQLFEFAIKKGLPLEYGKAHILEALAKLKDAKEQIVNKSTVPY